MLNKKAQAIGISPLKMLFAFFIIVICLLILIISLSAFEDDNKENTSELVGSIVAEQLWSDILSKKIDDKSMVFILDDYYKTVLEYTKGPPRKEIVSRFKGFQEEISKLCNESVNEIIPSDKIFIKEISADHSMPFDPVTFKFSCEVLLSSSLSEKSAVSILEAAGFSGNPWKMSKGGLGFVDKVPGKDYKFRISVNFAE